MTQLQHPAASAAPNGTSVSLQTISFSSTLKPGVVNGFPLLPSRSKVSEHEFCMSDVWFYPDMPPAIRIRPNRHKLGSTAERGAHSGSQSQVCATLARNTCPSGPMLDVSPPQQSRPRELCLDNLLHCRTARGLPHQPCSQLVQA